MRFDQRGGDVFAWSAQVSGSADCDQVTLLVNGDPVPGGAVAVTGGRFAATVPVAAGGNHVTARCATGDGDGSAGPTFTGRLAPRPTARIDGAGHFRIYWKVILPLSRPALAALAIFTFQFWWAAFFWPLIVVSSPELYTLPLGLALFQEQNRTVWNLIMAGSVLASLPLIVVFLLFQRQFVRGISVSGLKG